MRGTNFPLCDIWRLLYLSNKQLKNSSPFSGEKQDPERRRDRNFKLPHRDETMNSIAAMLSVENLNVFFRAADGKQPPAVRDVSFSLQPGEVLGLVGESGSGKSVTSLAIMRLLPPQSSIKGDIFFQGENRFRRTGDEKPGL